MATRTLTDKFVQNLKSAPAGKRVEYWDKIVHTFGVRVTDKGAKTYVVYTRFPGSRIPTRRRIGNASKVSLIEARKKARKWIEQIELGNDPRDQERAARAEKSRQKKNSFGMVAEDWFNIVLKSQRKGFEVESDVRREFMKPWGKRPITSITEDEIAALIMAKAAKTPGQARNLLGYAKRLFRWAVGRRSIYGLSHSPAVLLRAEDLIGKKTIRRRVLSDEEIRLVWSAADATEYPYGPLFKMLLLTGQRKSEVGDARWSEFDLTKKLWTIPAERMKMDSAHVVPLAEDVVALLAALPRFAGGDYVWSTTFGATPVNGFSKAKERLDKMLPAAMGKAGTPWVIHDLRRTMRTGLSALPIADRVRELMIAHAQPGMHQIYDQYSYLPEKRDGFTIWAAALRTLVSA